jgi:alpha-L-rhamnosidase
MGFLPLCALPPVAATPAPAVVARQAATLTPYALRCESLTNPEGIGRARPEFSWKLRAAKSGLWDLRQAAYEVRVGTAAGKGDLWSSGRVASPEQYGVVFDGKPLRSGQRAFWSVRTWDGQGNASAWSASARFSVGLLTDASWSGKWIGWDAPDGAISEAQPFAGASWIWSAAEDALRAAEGTRSFERRFTLGNVPAKARMTLTADDHFTLFVNGREVRRSEVVTDGWRNPVTVDLAPYLRSGENVIRVDAVNTSEGPAGLIARLVVEGGPTLTTDGAWTSDGQPAKTVAPYGQGPWGRFTGTKVLRPTTLFSKDLRLDRRLVRATAHVTALGLVDLSINGKRVSEDLFTPGWTNYHKRIYARTYDVTKAFRRGRNRVELEVGDGWYSGYVGYSRERGHYGDRPRVRAQVDLEFSDGTRQTVGTDVNWRATTGRTVSQDFLAGEEYVANLKAGPSGRPYVAPDVKGKVEPFPGVPVLPYARLKPIKITPQGDGYVLDFGQNLAGFAHVKSRGKAGQRIQMQFVEALNPDGTPYTANLRSARAVDAYTFGSDRTEEWEPRFTFHGFRYMKLTGLGRAPKPEEFTAVAISSATPETGNFESSDAMLNKLAKNAWWTQKMNFIDVPTDCPQRDERLGWTGDAQAYIRTAATYSDVQPFFRKWLVSLEDDQREDGQFPKVAPKIMNEQDGGPAWADAGVICPWTVYDVYGDRRLLAERYDSMRRFVEFTRARSTADLLPPRNFHCFGDWLSINANTPNDVIYEAYFAYTTKLLADAAQVLGKTEDERRYRDLYARIREAFAKAYVSADGTVKGDTQTAYVLALGFDLIPAPELRAKAAERLVKNIEARNWHLSTGFVGTRDLMRVLTEIGRTDVAFRLLHNTTFPSWGFEIVNGATTVWERWDGWTPERGFQDPGMNSFAHYAYGAVMGWVYQTVGGIDNAEPGFAKIRIAPQIDPKLTWAKTSFESVRGPIRTEWRRTDGKLRLNVEVPPNATAEVRLPNGEVRNVGSGLYEYVMTDPVG